MTKAHASHAKHEPKAKRLPRADGDLSIVVNGEEYDVAKGVKPKMKGPEIAALAGLPAESRVRLLGDVSRQVGEDAIVVEDGMEFSAH